MSGTKRIGSGARRPIRRPRVAARIVVAALAVFAAAMPAASSKSSEDCVPTSPETMLGVIDTYIKAIFHPEQGPAVPLAVDARRTSLPSAIPGEIGGMVNARSGDEIRAQFVLVPQARFLRDYGNVRAVIDVAQCQAILFWLLDFDAATVRLTVHPAERWRISNGIIEEIEEIQYRSRTADGSCWPAGDDPDEGRSGTCRRDFTTRPYGPTPGCFASSRDETVSIAQRYLDALVLHDASAVPLANGARRTEMPPPAAGPVTGTSAAEIERSLENEARFHEITAVRDVRWFVDTPNCQLVAYYLADHAPTRTVHHATRFLVSGSLIHEIEDISRGPIDSSELEGSCWPQAWLDAEDETYRLLPCPA